MKGGPSKSRLSGKLEWSIVSNKGERPNKWKGSTGTSPISVLILLDKLKWNGRGTRQNEVGWVRLGGRDRKLYCSFKTAGLRIKRGWEQTQSLEESWACFQGKGKEPIDRKWFKLQKRELDWWSKFPPRDGEQAKYRGTNPESI